MRSLGLGISLTMLFVGGTAAAQPTFTSVTDVYVEDFALFGAAGYEPGGDPADGVLDSNAWRVLGLSEGDTAFGGTYTTVPSDYGRDQSTGGVSTGGVYAFDVDNTPAPTAANYAWGVQPTGSDFTGGSHQLRILNSTGAPITALEVDYTIYTYNDAPRANTLNFSVVRASDLMPQLVSSLDYTTPEAASAAPMWVSTARTAIIDLSGMPIADGDYLILSWDSDDVGGSADRDEIAVDDILVGIPACGNGVLDTTETCDDGNIVTETECLYGTMTCMACNSTCDTILSLTGSFCGDGTVDASFEECDDGDTTSGDGCSATCTSEMDGGVDAGPIAVDAGVLDGGPIVTDAGPTDAGMADAGPTDTDGGTIGTDAGPMDVDASVAVDAGPGDEDAGPEDDAAMPMVDGGTVPGTDAGMEPDDDDGCGCSTPGRSSGSTPWLLAVLGLAVLVRRRRR